MQQRDTPLCHAGGNASVVGMLDNFIDPHWMRLGRLMLENPALERNDSVHSLFDLLPELTILLQPIYQKAMQ